MVDKEKLFDRHKYLERERNRRYTQKKIDNGYTRKTMWLQLPRESYNALVSWIQKQDLSILMKIVDLDIKAEYLMTLYLDRQKENKNNVDKKVDRSLSSKTEREVVIL